jgi:ATP/maltotriose-dependent transcriptional regulator MalT
MVARTLDLLGLLAFFASDFAAARAQLEASIDAARRVDDVYCLTDALGTVASIYPLMGEVELARQVGTEALRLASDRGDAQGTRMALFALAITAMLRGDAQESLVAAREGLEVCRRLSDSFFVAYFLWVLARAELLTGQLDRARESADESLELARAVAAPVVLACALEARAAVALGDGDTATASDLLDEAERLSEGGFVPGAYIVQVVRRRAELHVAQGQVDLARIRLREAIERARSIGDTVGATAAAAELAALA